jgi:hypothetical protein
MKYRGRECEARPFTDATGTGTEYLLDGAVVIREHSTRIISEEEQVAIDAAAQVMADAQAAADEREAVYQLMRDQLGSEAIATKVQAIQAARQVQPSPVVRLPP